jgi:hypothetical protein
MQQLSEAEVAMNAQATSVASSVVGEPIEAATRCELITREQRFAAAGLPNTFVLAVSATKVYAIEDRQEGSRLVAGKVLRDWDRQGFVAKAPAAPAIAVTSGVGDDQQVLVLYLPMDGAKTRYMQAAASHVAAAGSPGMPTKVMVAMDDAGQKLLGAIVSVRSDPVDHLTKLAALRDRGVLSEEEFVAQKARILGAMSQAGQGRGQTGAGAGRGS